MLSQRTTRCQHQETLADLERQAIADAVERSGHNLTRAASALGIDRTTLHRKLKKHGLRDARA